MNDLEIHDSAEKIRDPQERAAFIKQACAGDADRIARVEQMLGVDSVPDGGLPPVDKWVDRDPGSAPSSDPLVGQSIGGVRFVRVISEGSMGRVVSPHPVALLPAPFRSFSLFRYSLSGTGFPRPRAASHHGERRSSL